MGCFLTGLESEGGGNFSHGGGRMDCENGYES
jgi:hypothetical protein